MLLSYEKDKDAKELMNSKKENENRTIIIKNLTEHLCKVTNHLQENISVNKMIKKLHKNPS